MINFRRGPREAPERYNIMVKRETRNGWALNRISSLIRPERLTSLKKESRVGILFRRRLCHEPTTVSYSHSQNPFSGHFQQPRRPISRPSWQTSRRKTSERWANHPSAMRTQTRY